MTGMHISISCQCVSPIYVDRDKDEAKFWLDSVRIQSNRGFSRTEINHIQKLVEQGHTLIRFTTNNGRDLT